MKTKNYFKRLTESLTDNKNLGVEFMLTWISFMLTLIVVLILIEMIYGG